MSDRFVRGAVERNLRSRAAFKLEEMASRFRLLRRGMSVLDLGSAPGGWLQIASQRVGSLPVRIVAHMADAPRARPVEAAQPERGRRQGRSRLSLGAIAAAESEAASGLPASSTPSEGRARAAESGFPAPEEVHKAFGGPRAGRVIGVDLRPIPPVPGAAVLIGDMLDPATQDVVCSWLPRGSADVVLSDMAHAFVGDAATDATLQAQLAWKAVAVAARVLAPGGSLVVKTRHGADAEALRDACARAFASALLVKPEASRSESAEMFVVARRFRGHAGRRVLEAALPSEGNARQ